jgi:PTS system nitrogen regulatory IIA component
MNLKRALSKDTVSLELTSDTKEGIIEEMMDLISATGKVKDRKAALKAVLDREKKMSTGMQSGIAIPHAKCDIVEGLVAALGIKKGGIDFDALDGKPSEIFVMTLSPTKRAGPHVQFLAEISRLLNDGSVRERIIKATTKEEVVSILSL